MIRKLTDKDREMVVEYLSDEPAINLFALGDIENYGFESEIQELWGQFVDGQELEGVLLRYKNNYIPYYKTDGVDQKAFKEIIFNGYKEGDIFLSGKASILKDFKDLLPGYSYKETYFCQLTEGSKLKPYDGFDIKLADVSDAKRVYDLIETIDEFTGHVPPESYEVKIKDKSGRIYYIENEDGLMETVVQTTAECVQAAMIVGVATIKQSRGRGLMSACLSKMCEELLSEGKSICLFYDNPKAGSVYHAQGFESIDQWVMMKKV